jgi:hypothetical protein
MDLLNTKRFSNMCSASSIRKKLWDVISNYDEPYKKSKAIP